MFGFKKRKAPDALSPYETANRSSFEGKERLRGLALMAAVGLSVSAMITSTPQWTAFAAPLPENEAGKTLPAFYQLVALNPLSHAQTEAEVDDYLSFFCDTPLMLTPVDFHAYISSPSAEETQRKLEEIRLEKEREARLKAEQEARIRRQQEALRLGSYVRFNRQGIPLSQKAGTVELDANGVPTHYSYCITGTATAYYGGTSTSIGARPVQGTVAVDPRKIPYGTRMWIVTADGSGVVYGLGVAEDTGGFIYLSRGPTIDVYMNSYEDCVNWGLRSVKIYILD